MPVIKVRMDGELVETTVGRILLREILPEEIPFSLINKVMKKGELADLIDYCYRFGGDKKTVILSDRLKDLGYRYATIAGISISIDDMLDPFEQGNPPARRRKRRSRRFRSSTPKA